MPPRGFSGLHGVNPMKKKKIDLLLGNPNLQNVQRMLASKPPVPWKKNICAASTTHIIFIN